MVQNHVPDTPDGAFLPHALGAHLWQGCSLATPGCQGGPERSGLSDRGPTQQLIPPVSVSPEGSSALVSYCPVTVAEGQS